MSASCLKISSIAPQRRAPNAPRVVVRPPPLRLAAAQGPGGAGRARPLEIERNGETRPARVLIAEDQYLTAWHLESMIEDFGGAVIRSVSSGEEAVTAAAEELPDIILLDVNLGGAIDGIEAARRIRGSLATPILFITAYSDPATVARAAAIGAARLTGKPILPDALRRELVALLG